MFGKKNEKEMGELHALVYFTSTLLELILANYKGKDREKAVEYIQGKIDWYRNMLVIVNKDKSKKTEFEEGCDSFFRSMESILYPDSN